MRSRENLAYAAGLFEGEGCFYVQRGCLNAEIRMTDREPLEKFVEAVGIGYVRDPQTRRPPQLPVYKVAYYNFNEVQAIVAMLWHWLGPRRRAKAAGALKAYGAARSWERQPSHAWRIRTGWRSPLRGTHRTKVPA